MATAESDLDAAVVAHRADHAQVVLGVEVDLLPRRVLPAGAPLYTYVLVYEIGKAGGPGPLEHICQ